VARRHATAREAPRRPRTTSRSTRLHFAGTRKLRPCCPEPQAAVGSKDRPSDRRDSVVAIGIVGPATSRETKAIVGLVRPGLRSNTVDLASDRGDIVVACLGLVSSSRCLIRV